MGRVEENCKPRQKKVPHVQKPHTPQVNFIYFPQQKEGMLPNSCAIFVFSLITTPFTTTEYYLKNLTRKFFDIIFHGGVSFLTMYLCLGSSWILSFWKTAVRLGTLQQTCVHDLISALIRTSYDNYNSLKSNCKYFYYFSLKGRFCFCFVFTER